MASSASSSRVVKAASTDDLPSNTETTRARHAVTVVPSLRSVASASGSTSQAASIVEALEVGATALLLDEDTCATNLMLRSSGALFHIDFGYMLGRDPKPFPPPMKLCKEMVEAMGGADSELYVKFKLLCCEAFNLLRAKANLILNLLMLMVDAEIPDLRGEQEVLAVAKKFRLDLTNEEASRYFQELINDSVSALFPQITETIHRWAQYWRS